MTTKAYVLIETAVGKTRDVADALRSAKEMDDVSVVTGPYDVIAVLSAADINSVGDLITSKVHSVEGVVRTVTCMSVGDVA